MPFLTEEDYQMLPDAIRAKIQKAEADYESGKKTEVQFQEAIKKIYSNPSTKKAFEKLNKDAELGLDLPKSPLDNYVAPLEKEIEDIKKENKMKESLETKKQVLAKLAEMNIPESKLPEIAEFQTKHGITNNLSAIDFWAAQQEPEPISAEYRKPFSFGELPKEEDVMNKTLTEILQFKKSANAGRR
jgi:hypothetical protein